jgi:predicted DNA binding CopG/RHH family protein
MKPVKRKVPKFKSEAKERAFWQREDSTDYIDWQQAKPARFSRLKPSSRTISIRLPESLLEDIKRLASKRDVPYQSLLKILLAETVSKHKH